MGSSSPSSSDSREVRLIKASIRFIAICYILGGATLSCAGIVGLLSALGYPRIVEIFGRVDFSFFGIAALVSASYILVGLRLFQFKSRTRSLAIVLAGISMLFIPIGTVAGIVFFKILNSEGASEILGESKLPQPNRKA